MNEHNML